MVDEDLREHRKEIKRLKEALKKEERKKGKTKKEKEKKPAAADAEEEDDEPIMEVDEKNHYSDFLLPRWSTGVLLVNVVQAKDLPIADIGVGSSIDPFFRLVRFPARPRPARRARHPERCVLCGRCVRVWRRAHSAPSLRSAWTTPRRAR